MITSIKRRMQGGEVLRLFSTGRIVHPIIIEMFAQAGGFDGFWLDGEHTAQSADQMVVSALAARANGMDCFVRIPPIGYWQVMQCMEAGFGGVMGAQIQSTAHAEQFVRWAKFPPRGDRGLILTGRDANYTHKAPAPFIEESDRERLVGIQIETLGALHDVEAIAAIDAVDLVFVGPNDLSLALGVVGQYHHEKLWEGIRAVQAACSKHGKSWGCVAPDADFAQKAREHGCQMLTMGNEMLALRRGIDALKAVFAAQFA